MVCIRERTKCFPEINDNNYFLLLSTVRAANSTQQKQMCPENDCGEVVHYCYSEEAVVSKPLEVMAAYSKLKATNISTTKKNGIGDSLSHVTIREINLSILLNAANGNLKSKQFSCQCILMASK